MSHEEVSEWAAGTRDAMLISVSHAWETREHPDPCGDQLKRLVNCLSLYDAAYSSEIWVFYDYVSLFQYERQTDAENESFRRSMSHMHMCYAHECNWTVRLEALTPDNVWQAALQSSEHLVMVYDDKSKSVRGRPLKELMHNRVEPHTILSTGWRHINTNTKSLIGIAGGARPRWSGPLAGAGPSRTSGSTLRAPK